MVEESLLTDAVRELVGTTSEMGSATVTATAVRRAGEVYLGEPGSIPAEGGDVAGVVIAALETGTARFNLPELMPNSLVVTSEWLFERPLRLGETLAVRSRLADISERFGGRFGYSIFFRTDIEFSDGEGAVVARSSTTLMQYDARNAGAGGDVE